MATWREPVLVLGVALEAVAVVAAIDGMAALALAAHVGSCGGIAVGLGPRLPAGAAAGRLAFAMILFLPVLGALGWIAAAVVRPVTADRRLPALVRTPLPGSDAARLPMGRSLTPPGARPVSDRVVAARGQCDPGAIALLRRALGDPEEDVRLVAHAVLESKHRSAYRQLHERTAELAAAPADLCAALHRRLAAQHWELARTGLAEGDCLAHALDRARHHARVALAEDPDQPSLWLLLARTALRCGTAEEADAALVRAVELGLPPAVAAPYFAEAAFLQRRFDRVLHQLAAAAAGELAALDRIRRYWS
jgi:hypothetical protein